MSIQESIKTRETSKPGIYQDQGNIQTRIYQDLGNIQTRNLSRPGKHPNQESIKTRETSKPGIYQDSIRPGFQTHSGSFYTARLPGLFLWRRLIEREKCRELYWLSTGWKTKAFLLEQEAFITNIVTVILSLPLVISPSYQCGYLYIYIYTHHPEVNGGVRTHDPVTRHRCPGTAWQGRGQKTKDGSLRLLENTGTQCSALQYTAGKGFGREEGRVWGAIKWGRDGGTEREREVAVLSANLNVVLQCWRRNEAVNSSWTSADDDDELMLNVLRCHLTY